MSLEHVPCVWAKIIPFLEVKNFNPEIVFTEDLMNEIKAYEKLNLWFNSSICLY